MYNIRKIKCIYFGKSKGKDFFVIETDSNNIILNISKGKEEHNLNIKFKDVIYIYEDNDNYLEPFQLNSISTVVLLRKVELVNSSTNKNISSPYLLGIEDSDKNLIYVDIMLNQIFNRKDNYKLDLFTNTVIDDIFKINKKNRVFISKLRIQLYKKLSILFDLQEEEET